MYPKGLLKADPCCDGVGYDHRPDPKWEIVIRAITAEYIRSMAGFTGTKGRLLKALRNEKLEK